MLETLDDLRMFHDPNDFGVLATVRPVGGAPSYQVRGTLIRAHTPLSPVDGVELAGRDVRFETIEADLVDSAKGDEIEIEGVTRTVVARRPDGEGIIELVLRETYP